LLVRWLFAVAFLAVAVPLAVFAPTARSDSWLLFCLLELAFAVSTRIEFETGSGLTVPTQLMLVPMLFVLPARQVPLAVALALVLGHLPELWRRQIPPGRVLVMIGNAWYSLAPALVFLVFQEPEPEESWGVLLLALIAQLGADFVSSLGRERLALGIPPQSLVRPLLRVLAIDALLTPVGFAAALGSVVTKPALFLPTPLLVLLWSFARDHRQRLDQALQLSEANRALEQRAEELRHSQKMEVIGQLAGGIAHDFNNLLTVIGGYSEILLGRVDAGENGRKEIAAIGQAADSAAELTRQLLAFSRKEALSRRPLDLNAVVTETQTMIERLVSDNIEFSTHLAADVGMISADRGQIEQIIINLVVNARDAMPRGGKMVLETANVALDDVTIDAGLEAPSLGFVRLTLTDSGVGMDPGTVDKIFDPFFSTKKAGAGTGLGLSTVKMIVEQSHGRIQVDS
jgi:signal transduction histidine kinase